MNELRDYVNSLFIGHRKTAQTKDLKEEIYGNLEARKADLISLGTTEAEAIEQAKNSITSIEGLIDGNKEVYIYQFRRELLQWSLIYLISACIIMMPMLMVHIGTPFSTLGFLITIITGIVYIRFSAKGRKSHLNDRTYVNLTHYERIRKLFWAFWAAFVLVYTAAITAMYFGSNIWFSRKVSISGPNELAVIVIIYAVPFFTIIIPLIVNKIPGLIVKYEVHNDEEKK